MLCGSCSKGYGQVRVHECQKCKSRIGSGIGFALAFLTTVLIVILFLRLSLSSLLAFEHLHTNHRPGRRTLRNPTSYYMTRQHSTSHRSFLGLSSFPMSTLSGCSDCGVEMTEMDGDVDAGESNLSVLVSGIPASDGSMQQDRQMEKAQVAHQHAVQAVEVFKV